MQYAKAKEGEGRFAEAAAAYEAAGDTDAVVRLCVERLGDLSRGLAAAQRGCSTSTCELLARCCITAGEVPLALQALLLAGTLDQAYDLAASRGLLDLLACLVMDGAKVCPAERAPCKCHIQKLQQQQ